MDIKEETLIRALRLVHENLKELYPEDANDIMWDVGAEIADALVEDDLMFSSSAFLYKIGL
jgi:hypothetical protein